MIIEPAERCHFQRREPISGGGNRSWQRESPPAREFDSSGENSVPVILEARIWVRPFEYLYRAGRIDYSHLKGYMVGVASLKTTKWVTIMRATFVVTLLICALYSYAALASTGPFSPEPAGISGEGPFALVERGSWIYHDIAQFARMGLVEGYSERSFSGDRLYTRYEIACIISRLTNAIETRKPPVALNSAQKEAVKRLRSEFVSELAMVSVQEISFADHSPQVLPRSFADPGAGVTLSDLLSGKEDLPAAVPPAEAKKDKEKAQPATFTLLSQDRIKAELKIPVLINPEGKSDKPGAAPEGAPAGRNPRDGQQDDKEDVIASVGLEYALSKLANVSAGYILSQAEAQDDGQTSTKGTAMVGIDYSLLLGDSAFLKAGYSYSRSRNQSVQGLNLGKGAGVSLELDLPFLWQSLAKDGSNPSQDSAKSVASLGIGYSFGTDTLLSLGYKLIDFTEISDSDQAHTRTNMATAELTIRF